MPLKNFINFYISVNFYQCLKCSLFNFFPFVVVQLLSSAWLFSILWTSASLSFTIPQFAQAHGRWVDDTIQPSHPLSSPSPLALTLSQHQGLFQWVCSSASILLTNSHNWFPLGLTGLISQELSGIFSITTVQNHQFFNAQPFLWSNSHIGTRQLEKT